MRAMWDELTHKAVLGAVDDILGLSPKGVDSAGKLWPRLDIMLDELLDAVKFDVVHHRRLTELAASLRAAASQFIRSLLNLEQGGSLRGDWARFAEHDFVKLKDELLALREFLVSEVSFLKFACLRAGLRRRGVPDPERLFEELHREGAISERTWVLLMSQPGEWRRALRDREFLKELMRISSWLLDLQEVRGIQRSLVRDPDLSPRESKNADRKTGGMIGV